LLINNPSNGKDNRLSEQEIQLQNRIKQLQQEIQLAKSANRVTESQSPSPRSLSKQQSLQKVMQPSASMETGLTYTQTNSNVAMKTADSNQAPVMKRKKGNVMQLDYFQL
jgi:hypothetical protein